MKKSTTLLGEVDIFIYREEPETIFQYMADVSFPSDITFANTKQSYSNKGCFRPIYTSYPNPNNLPDLLYASIEGLSSHYPKTN